jgi:hypothetical protein
MPDPLNPREHGESLLRRLMRECPQFSREDILAIASQAGFDLESLGIPNSSPSTGSEKPSTK